MESIETKIPLPKYVVLAFLSGDVYFVIFSDGSKKAFDAVELGCDWFRMSNDAFFEIYGFNFNPHEYAGLYERCRKLVYGE